jgi:hypothetical protein
MPGATSPLLSPYLPTAGVATAAGPGMTTAQARCGGAPWIDGVSQAGPRAVARVRRGGGASQARGGRLNGSGPRAAVARESGAANA